MTGLLIVGLLFLAGALYNLFGADRSTVEALGGLAIAATLIGTHLFVRGARRRDAEFLLWLDANRDGVQSEGASYEGTSITASTELTQYELVASFLIVSFRIPSRLYVDRDASVLTALLFALLTFVLGWWGIPWGPLYTVRALWNNLRGGTRRTVGDLLGADEAAETAPGS
jgi:hypothetical protein